MAPKQSASPINVDYFEDLTGTISLSAERSVEDLGNRVRSLRKKKGLTMKALSELTGFHTDMLASIENNEIQPQLGTIIRLSKALDAAFGRLVGGSGDKLYSITRKDDDRPYIRSTSRKGRSADYIYSNLASEVKGRNMEALIVQLAESPDQPISIHDGEEFIFVLDGVVALRIGDDTLELEAGDSVYYLSTVPHILTAKKGKATVLAVVYEG